jgi:hypothetical protein
MTSSPLCDINKYDGVAKALLNLSFLAGGTMKTLFCVTTICSLLFVVGVSSVQSQPQTFEGYTVISGPWGAQVCLGRWLPPKDVAMPGMCEGQLMDMAQFTAGFTKMSADRLDQAVLLLGLIDQKLALNNDLVSRLLESTVKTQTSMEQHVIATSELLREAITKRFDALSEEILASEQFREEFLRLKEDILKEVEKNYTTRPAPVKK